MWPQILRTHLKLHAMVRSAVDLLISTAAFSSLRNHAAVASPSYRIRQCAVMSSATGSREELVGCSVF